MSPSRLAAKAHNVRSGSADPWQGWIQVLYLDESHTYERSRYGHELTHVLAYNLDPNHLYHLKLIDEGLAQFFDQSGCNYHQDFVQECRAYKSDLETSIQLIQDDIFAYSYPKAASFIQNLFHIDPDPDKFKAFYEKCYIYWDYNEPYAPDLEPLDRNKLIEIIDSQLVDHYGVTLEQFNERWLDDLRLFLEIEPLRPSQDDIDEIKQLFSFRDSALSNGNAELYRFTMEGFNCDRITDSERMDRAVSMTSNPAPVQSTVIEVFDMGIRNYPTALVHFEKNINGKTEFLIASVEHYPLGWKFNWVEDEYERTRLTSHSWITNLLFKNHNIFYDPNILVELMEEQERAGLFDEAELLKHIAVCIQTNQSLWPLLISR